MTSQADAYDENYQEIQRSRVIHQPRLSLVSSQDLDTVDNLNDTNNDSSSELGSDIHRRTHSDNTESSQQRRPHLYCVPDYREDIPESQAHTKVGPILDPDAENTGFNATLSRITAAQKRPTADLNELDSDVDVDENSSTVYQYARLPVPPEGYFSVPGLPPPHQWAGALARSIVEIFAGHRSSLQITRWLDPDLYEYFLHRIQLEQESSIVHDKKQFRAQLIQIHATKAQQRSDDPLVDCSATVFDGRELRLIAMRLRGSSHKWIIDQLEIN